MTTRNLKSVFSELDTLVLNVELTLISITQGVALYFLIDNARVPLMSLEYATWPYVVMGLLIILIFWSRSVMHALTLIRWPIEFLHNFLYIASTLIEAVLFTQLAQPERWFVMNAIYGLAVWILFLVDLRLIRRLREEGKGAAEKELCLMVEKDQWLNIKFLVPAAIAYSVVAAVVVHYRPEMFLTRGGHEAIIILQIVAGLGYLISSLCFFRRAAPLTEKTRQEWQEEGL